MKRYLLGICLIAGFAVCASADWVWWNPFTWAPYYLFPDWYNVSIESGPSLGSGGFAHLKITGTLYTVSPDGFSSAQTLKYDEDNNTDALGNQIFPANPGVVQFRFEPENINPGFTPTYPSVIIFRATASFTKMISGTETTTISSHGTKAVTLDGPAVSEEVTIPMQAD